MEEGGDAEAGVEITPPPEKENLWSYLSHTNEECQWHCTGHTTGLTSQMNMLSSHASVIRYTVFVIGRVLVH